MSKSPQHRTHSRRKDEHLPTVLVLTREAVRIFATAAPYIHYELVAEKGPFKEAVPALHNLAARLLLRISKLLDVAMEFESDKPRTVPQLRRALSLMHRYEVGVVKPLDAARSTESEAATTVRSAAKAMHRLRQQSEKQMKAFDESEKQVKIFEESVSSLFGTLEERLNAAEQTREAEIKYYDEQTRKHRS